MNQLNSNQFFRDLMTGKFPSKESLMSHLFEKNPQERGMVSLLANTGYKLVGGDHYTTNAGPIDKNDSCISSLFVEDITNFLDEVLMKEWVKRGSIEAEKKWSRKKAIFEFFGVCAENQKEWKDGMRRDLADKTGVVRVWNPIFAKVKSHKHATVDKRDLGRGLTDGDLRITLLGMMRGNKKDFHFLTGKFGFGGSSRFASAFSDYTIIVSRSEKELDKVFFTVVFLCLFDGDDKDANYYYLEVDEGIPFVSIDYCEEVEAEMYEVESEQMGFADKSKESTPFKHIPLSEHCGTLIRSIGAKMEGVAGSDQDGNSLRYQLSNCIPGNRLPFRLADLPNLHGYTKKYLTGRTIVGTEVRLTDKINGKGTSTPLEWYTSIELDFPKTDAMPPWENEDTKGTFSISLSLFPHGKNGRDSFCESRHCGSISLDDQKHMNLSSKIITDMDWTFLAQHLYIHVDVSNVPRWQQKLMFSSDRQKSINSAETKALRSKIVEFGHGLKDLENYNKIYKALAVTDFKQSDEKFDQKIYKYFFNKKKADESENKAQGNGTEGGKVGPKKVEKLEASDNPTILEFVNHYDKKPKEIFASGVSSVTMKTDIPADLCNNIKAELIDDYGQKVADCKVSNRNSQGRLIITCDSLIE
jgi:hypothetical protein